MAYNVENSNYFKGKNHPSNKLVKPPDISPNQHPPLNQEPDPFPPLTSPPTLSYTSYTTYVNNGQRTPTPSPTPISSHVPLPPPNQPSNKRRREGPDDENRRFPQDPRTPTKNNAYHTLTHQPITPFITGHNTALPYSNPDEDMEEDSDTDWTEEKHHFDRLSKVRELLSELQEEFSAAQNERCLNFLTDDPEIKDHLDMLSRLTPYKHNANNPNPILTGISDIQKLIEQVSGKLDKIQTQPPTSPDKSINGSTHATTSFIPTTEMTKPNTKLPYNTTAKNTQSRLPQPIKPESKTPLNPKTSHHPSRMVVQFKPNGIPMERRPDPGQLVSNINAALALNPQSKHMKVVAANFNNQGNLILSTRSDQTAEELMKFQASFSHILSDLSNRQEIVIREDKKWFKIQIDGVNTGSIASANGRILHTAEEVHIELLACNPIYATAKECIVSKPRWLRTEEELHTTVKSSLVFALTDESTAREFLNQKALAAFGRHCTLRAFQDRPPVTQCRNCWSLDHTTHRCTQPQRCRLCSAMHDEKDHPVIDPAECHTCTLTRENGDSMDTNDEGRCPHGLRCANCIANNQPDNRHPADARRCPIRLEKYGTARDNEKRAQKTANPWIKTKPKKSKSKGINDQRAPTTNITPAQNRFDPLNNLNAQVHGPTPIYNPPQNLLNTFTQQ